MGSQGITGTLAPPLPPAVPGAFDPFSMAEVWSESLRVREGDHQIGNHGAGDPILQQVP